MSAQEPQRMKLSGREDVARLVREVYEGKLSQVHFMGLLLGITVFRERRTGRLCVQVNLELKCVDSPEEAVSLVAGKAGEVSEAVLFPKA